MERDKLTETDWSNHTADRVEFHLKWNDSKHTHRQLTQIIVLESNALVCNFFYIHNKYEKEKELNTIAKKKN